MMCRYWLSVHAYPSDPGDLDNVVHLLSAAVPQNCPYFFVRYADARGRHIRFRVLCSNAEHRQIIKSWGELNRVLMTGAGIQYAGIMPQRYLREVTRYRSVANVRALESIWCARSAMIIAFLRSTVGSPDRDVLRASAAKEILRQGYASLPAGQEELARHRDHWLRGLPDEVRRQSIERLKFCHLPPHLTPPPVAAPALPGLPAAAAMFYLAHLDVNRLGIDILAEGTIADSLLMELERGSITGDNKTRH